MEEFRKQNGEEEAAKRVEKKEEEDKRIEDEKARKGVRRNKRNREMA